MTWVPRWETKKPLRPIAPIGGVMPFHPKMLGKSLIYL